MRTVPGLDPSGDGGLLDLALSPTYLEDGLIYAYVTTATDNRPYEHLVPKVAIDEMNPPLRALSGRRLWAGRPCAARSIRERRPTPGAATR